MSSPSSLPTVLLAHGVGARGELPIPLWWVLYGAIAVIVFSFVALTRWWPAARWEDRTLGRPLGVGAERALAVARFAGRLFGALVLAVVTVSAMRGGELPPYAVFIGLWVVVPVAAALLGDAWSLLNPFAGLAAVLDRAGVGHAPRWLARAGRYPAAVVLLLFGWLELAHPDPADADVMLGFLLAYTGAMVLGGLWWGAAWVRQADAFGVLFGLIGRVGILGRGTEGGLRLRPPLVGLTEVAPVRGTAAVVLVAIGVTSFDGLSRSAVWEDLLGTRTGWQVAPPNTVGLLLLVAVVMLAYLAAMSSAATLVERPAGELVEGFAHTLVPVAVGYAVAHYFSLVVFDGQLLLAYASDPLDLGWDLFGTAGNTIDFDVVVTTTIAWVQIGAILLGHVGGVVLAHDRAVARFDPGVAGPSQHALLGAMVLYTVGGLVLLLGA